MGAEHLSIRRRMSAEELAQLTPDKLFNEFGPVAVGGREQEWKEICNRVYRLWETEKLYVADTHKESVKVESD